MTNWPNKPVSFVRLHVVVNLTACQADLTNQSLTRLHVTVNSTACQVPCKEKAKAFNCAQHSIGNRMLSYPWWKHTVNNLFLNENRPWPRHYCITQTLRRVSTAACELKSLHWQVTGENPLTTKFFYTEVILKTTRVLLWVVKMGPEIYNRKTKTTTTNQQLVLERHHTNAQRPKSPTVTLTWHRSTQKVHKLQQRHTLKDKFHKGILLQLAGHTWHLEKMSSCVTWTLKFVRTSSTWSRRPWLRTS